MPCSDIEPCWLPDGSITSVHALRTGGLLALPVSNLPLRCGRQRRLGLTKCRPSIRIAGRRRVCYTRWEYNDRSASGLQQLFAMNPDGTRQTGLFAVTASSLRSCTRGIPGTRDIMMLPGHHVAQKASGKALLAEADDY